MSTEPLDIAEDHPKVVRAMRLYDEILTDDEKRNIFLNSIREAVAAEQEGYYGNRMTRWAESLNVSIVMWSDQGYREAIRDAKTRPAPRYEDCLDVADVLVELGLREGGGAR